jgi:hypothetical protein
MEDIFALTAEPLSDGTWINSNVARTIEAIQDYDPMLEVKWLPRDKRIDGADVFQIVDTRINRVAFTVKSEAEMNETVLAKIFKADVAKKRGGPLTILEEIDQENAAHKVMKAKEKFDEDMQKQELATSILKSPLNAYTHDGYRYDLHPTNQPKKGIFDVAAGHQETSKKTVR